MFDISLFFQKKSTQNDIRPKTIALSNCNSVNTTGFYDHLFYLNIGENDKCLGLFDGNGDNSKDFSQIAGNFCMESLQDEWTKIRDYVVTSKINKLNNLIKNIYESVDEYLDIRLSDEEGGCSALIVGLVKHHSNTFCFSANIGNIACVLYENKKIIHLWDNHVPDNIEEWIRYCKRISANKRKHFVYNTINCYNEQGLPIGPIIETEKYNNRPIPIFEYKNNVGSVIKENVTLLQKTNIPLGGTETMRNHITINKAGVPIVDPNHAHENTGATVDGKIKLTRTLGNYKIRKQCYLDMEPSFYFRKLTNQSTLVLGTDGFYNLWKYNILRDNLISNESTSSEFVQMLYGKTLETAAANERYQLIENKYPIWDDMAFIVVKVNKKDTIDCPEMIHPYSEIVGNGEKATNNDIDDEEVLSYLNNIGGEANKRANAFHPDEQVNQVNQNRRNRKARKQKKKNKAIRTAGRNRRKKRWKARNPKNRH